MAGLHIWLPSPYLKPGGTYVVEDLSTAYYPEYGGSARNQRNGNTGAEVIKDIIDLKLAWEPHADAPNVETVLGRNIGKNRARLARHVSDVHCSSEICALIKKRLV
jgi:hypothetical protein